MSLFYSLVASIWQPWGCAIRGLSRAVTSGVGQWCPAPLFEICSPHFTFGPLVSLYIQNSRPILKMWSPLLVFGLSIWFLAPLLLNPGDGPGAEARTFWARLLVFKATFVYTVLAVVNYVVIWLNVFYSLVLTCSLIFLQLWLLGPSVQWSDVEILVGDCSLYSKYLVQSSFLFCVGTPFPHHFF